MKERVKPVGTLLREWRQHRRLSQLNLSLEAEVSSRHLSFLETGRSHPSREMVLHLAERLDIPLREQNVLLVAAGYAPVFPEKPLPPVAQKVVQRILTAHEPYPALAIDRHWNLVTSNRAVGPLLVGVAPALLTPPVNVLRLSLHPEGLAPFIANLSEWRSHLLTRLQRQIEVTADPVLVSLRTELKGYPVPTREHERTPAGEPKDYAGIAVPLRLVTEHGVLTFLSTTTVFGTPVDITLSELAIETFLPLDAATSEALLQLTR